MKSRRAKLIKDIAVKTCRKSKREIVATGVFTMLDKLANMKVQHSCGEKFN